MGRRIAIVGLSLALLLTGAGIVTAITAGSAMGPSFRGGAARTEVDEQTFTVAGVPTFTLAGGNGSVTITRGGDDTKVIVRATKRAPSDDLLRWMQVQTVQNGNEIAVREEHTPAFFGFGAHAGVDYAVQLPARATIAPVRLGNGQIEVSGIAGTLDLETNNGAVTVRDFDGAVSVQSMNGRITLANGRGMVHVETRNGAVEAQNVQAAGLNIRTANGRVGFAGSLAPGSDSRIETSNGTVSVQLPPESNFRLDAKTHKGTVTVGFPVAVAANNNDDDRDEVRGIVGTADRTLTLRSSNGSITVGKQG